MAPIGGFNDEEIANTSPPEPEKFEPSDGFSYFVGGETEYDVYKDINKYMEEKIKEETGESVKVRFQPINTMLGPTNPIIRIRTPLWRRIWSWVIRCIRGIRYRIWEFSLMRKSSKYIRCRPTDHIYPRIETIIHECARFKGDDKK